MKVFYLVQENFGCVVYADNENDAFEKMKCQRKELLETLGLPLDITRFGLCIVDGNKHKDTLCKIDERWNREVERNYKIVLVPVYSDDEVIREEDYYTSDLIDLIKHGHIKIVV